MKALSSTHPKKSTPSKIYFPQLDTLRFCAFLLVFVSHCVNIVDSRWIREDILNVLLHLGWIGVDLFFVLSGFLITFLIFSEKKTEMGFSLPKFYIRRSLRIWPLYFLAIVVSFIILPIVANNFFQQKFIFPLSLKEYAFYVISFFVFLGNITFMLHADIIVNNFPLTTHLWTLSLEEQFYLFWPFLLRFVKSTKKIVVVALFLIIIAFIIRYINGASHQLQAKNIYFNTLTRLDTLLIGSLLGIFFSLKTKFHTVVSFLEKPLIAAVLLMLFLLFLYCFCNQTSYTQFEIASIYPVIAVYFATLIYFMLHIEGALKQITTFSWTVWLGKISYGLYIWHRVSLDWGLFLSKIILQGYNFYLYIILAFLIDLSLSVLSYYAFERYFLKLKTHFSQIRSRPI